MYSRSGSYTTDKPPYCEMILRAVSDSTPPPDLTVSLTLTGGELLEPIILERKAEHPSPPPKINLLQAATSQGSESHKEDKAEKVESEVKDTDKHKASQDDRADSRADPDPAPLPVSLSSSHSASIQSGTEFPQQEGIIIHVIILTDNNCILF